MAEARTVEIGPLRVSNAGPLTLIAGPCQLEGRDHALRIAETLAAICVAEGVGLIFKSSYDKANRTSLGAPRGMGMDEGLAVLVEIRERIGCPVLTDVHAARALRAGRRGRGRAADPGVPEQAD